MSTSTHGENGPRFFPADGPRRIAHRGLAPDGAENTLRAFQDALDAGADMLETDTRATADGVALAVHDPDLSRIADDPREIADLHDVDVDGVRVAGTEPLARLEDVLGTFTAHPVNIDVKDTRAVEPAVRAITRTGAADRVCVTSFVDSVAHAACRGIQEATGTMPRRSPSRRAIGAFVAARALEARGLVRRVLAPYGAIQVPVAFGPIRIIGRRQIAAAHDAGVEVHVWTIDEMEEMRALLALGVDGIITNRVDLLTRVLQER